MRFYKRNFLKRGVHAALHGKEERHFVGAELVDHHKGVFAIHLGDVVDIPVHVFARNRQVFEICQNMTADLGQHFRLIGADVKHLILLFSNERIEADGKYRKLASAAGSFKQAVWVGIKTRWRIGIYIPYAPGVIVV